MGGFFPKVNEQYGDGDREYNWWGCSYTLSEILEEVPVGIGEFRACEEAMEIPVDGQSNSQ